MNPNLEHDITQTLEVCLARMSQKLKESFDPIEKLSLQLLRQYRSTIAIYQSWRKKVNSHETNKTVEHTQNQNAPQYLPKSKAEKRREKEQKERLAFLKQNVINKEKELARLLKLEKEKSKTSAIPPSHQPSGLLYSPS